MAPSLRPPASVQGMLKLDRKAFTSSFTVPALKIDAKHCHKMRKALSRVILRTPRIKDIVPDPSDRCKKLLLLDSFNHGNGNFKEDEQKAVNESNAEMTQHELLLTYDHYTAEQILSAILPDEMEVTSSFATVGHIAHMNLRECHQPFREIIGEVILDKNPSIKTVVNKTDSIEETFRFFKMEVLAGEDNMNACVKQHGCTFEFDFSKVYWNSRLQTEHQRIVDILKPGDIVCDVFAGVGPFAIPAAKKGCTVHANDLNPDSYNALKQNISINKVAAKVSAHNKDGRKFLQDIFGLEESNCGGSKETKLLKIDHVIMNLPAISVEFLDVFRKFDGGFDDVSIHCYCFSAKNDPYKDAERRIRDMLGNKVGSCTIHHVRNVAPNKLMMCVSFQLLNGDDNGAAASLDSLNGQHESSKKGVKRKAED